MESVKPLVSLSPGPCRMVCPLSYTWFVPFSQRGFEFVQVVERWMGDLENLIIDRGDRNKHLRPVSSSWNGRGERRDCAWSYYSDMKSSFIHGSDNIVKNIHLPSVWRTEDMNQLWVGISIVNPSASLSFEPLGANTYSSGLTTSATER